LKFYTADWHLNNPNIIKYAHRPYKSAERMIERLIGSANMRAKTKNDVIFHIGDFCAWGNERGVPSLKISPKKHVEAINATLILLEGNHDGNNKVKSPIKYLFTDLGTMYKDVSIGHYPSHYKEATNQFHRNTIRLCGHVHQAWKWYFDEDNNVLNINMGVDVWNQQIINENEVINFIQSIERKLGKKWSTH